jgi:signal transduction histidine kinase/CheY-like chemotaxis protein
MFYIGFPVLSLVYVLLLLGVYYSKKRINLFENKVVSILMIINAIGLILEILCYIVLVFLRVQDTSIGITILKSYVFYMYVFDWVLNGYICMLTNKNHNEEKYDKVKYYNRCLCLTSPIIITGFIVTYFTKLNYYNISPKYYTYGTSINFLVYATCILAPFWIYRCIKASAPKKSRESNTKEYNIRICTILLGIILVGVAGAMIQLVDRSMLILTAAHTLMLVLMYFTIENPDLQMVEELTKNRKLTEENFEEKTNFIFKISQELKQPLQDITRISKNIYDTTKDSETKEQAKIININSKQLYSYVNNALDISTMDIRNLKIVEGKYNSKNFFEEIKLRIKNELKTQNKDVDLRFNISKNMPEYLSGDNTKLKQVIITVILNSIKYTETGFIELNVDSIIRYGICRLLIEVSDSGKGMELKQINEILSISPEITKEEAEKIDKLSITLPIAHKIIKALDGSLMIKSEKNKGTNILIAVDQKIEEKKKNEKNYSNKIINEKKIMMVTNDAKIIRETKKQLEDITVVTTPFAKDCLSGIKKENYACILIDEEINGESGTKVVKEIKKLKNIPTLILIKKQNEFLGKHYISDGFDNTIIKEDYNKEISKIKKYL